MVQKQLSLRRELEPTGVSLVIVAESPPISGKYLYNPDGKVSEPLFNALMKLLGSSLSEEGREAKGGGKSGDGVWPFLVLASPIRVSPPALLRQASATSNTRAAPPPASDRARPPTGHPWSAHAPPASPSRRCT